MTTKSLKSPKWSKQAGGAPVRVQPVVRALPEMVPWCDDIDVDDYVPLTKKAKRMNAKRKL